MKRTLIAWWPIIFLVGLAIFVYVYWSYCRRWARPRRTDPGRVAPRSLIGRRGRGRTDTPLTRHRLLRPARLPFRHSPAASLARRGALAALGPGVIAWSTGCPCGDCQHAVADARSPRNRDSGSRNRRDANVSRGAPFRSVAGIGPNSSPGQLAQAATSDADRARSRRRSLGPPSSPLPSALSRRRSRIRSICSSNDGPSGLSIRSTSCRPGAERDRSQGRRSRARRPAARIPSFFRSFARSSRYRANSLSRVQLDLLAVASRAS